MSALLEGPEKSDNEPSSGGGIALPKVLLQGGPLRLQRACPQNQQKEANKRPLVGMGMCSGNRESAETSAVGQELNESCNLQLLAGLTLVSYTQATYNILSTKHPQQLRRAKP